MKNLRFLALALAGAIALTACGAAADSGHTVQPTPTGPSATFPSSGPGPTVGLTPPNDEPYDAVYYDNPGVNPFIDTEDDPLSTFALDVDTGSYTVARRYLSDGHLPDKDSVRVEEYVNYFDQDYPVPSREEGLSLTVDGGTTPFVQNPRNRVIRIGVQAADLFEEERADANLVFVIDTSSSMAREDRLGLVKQSLTLMVGSLRSTDTVGIVEYGSTAQEVLSPTAVADEDAILRAIDSLHPNGSTNAAHGLQLGYRMAAGAFREGGINRVILGSDGVANTGDATGAEAILDLVAAESERDVELVTVGFGMGNYNDELMEQLADQGDGFYAYVDTIEEAQKIFVEDLSGTLQTVAKDARVQVEFDTAAVQSWRLIGFENRAMADDQFRDDSVDAGEIGAGHTVTALYEVKPVNDVGVGNLGVVKLRWIEPASSTPREIDHPIAGEALGSEFEDTAPRFQLDVLVAQYAEVLRESVWAQQAGSTLADVVQHAERLPHLLPDDEDVLEFVGLARQAAAVAS